MFTHGALNTKCLSSHSGRALDSLRIARPHVGASADGDFGQRSLYPRCGGGGGDPDCYAPGVDYGQDEGGLEHRPVKRPPILFLHHVHVEDADSGQTVAAVASALTIACMHGMDSG